MAKYGKDAGKEEYTLEHLHPALSAEDKALGWMNSLSGDMRCEPPRNIHFVPFRRVAWGWLLVTFRELKNWALAVWWRSRYFPVIYVEPG